VAANELTSTGAAGERTAFEIAAIQFVLRNLGVGRWSGVLRVSCLCRNARSQLLPDQETVTSKKIKKRVSKSQKVFYILNGSMLEFEARRSPYLESSSIITCGGPRSILAAAALRLR